MAGVFTGQASIPELKMIVNIGIDALGSDRQGRLRN